MAIILNDDFTGANGAAWNTSKWTVTKVAGGSTTVVDIQSNQGRHSHKAASDDLRAVRTGAATASQDIVLTITKPTTTANGRLNVLVHGSGTLTASAVGATFPNGYRLLLLPANGIVILYRHVSNTTGTNIWSVPGTDTTVFPSGSTRSIRIRYDGSAKTISLKIWDPASAEPTAWNFTSDESAQAIPATGTEAITTFMNTTNPAAHDWYMDNVQIDDLAAAQSVDVTVNETPATASATSPDATVSTTQSFPVTVTAPVATASGTALDASVTTTKSGGYAAQAATATATIVNPTWALTVDYATAFAEYPLGTPVPNWSGAASIATSAAALSGRWLTGGTGIDRYEGTPNVRNFDGLYRVRTNGGVLMGYTSTTNWWSAELFNQAGAVTLYLSRMLSGTKTFVVTQPLTGVSVNGFNWMRVNTFGGVIRVRVWANGALEPSTWQVQHTATTSLGKTGFSKTVGGTEGQLDYYAINTASGGAARMYSIGREIDAVALTATATIIVPLVRAGVSKTVNSGVMTATATAVDASLMATGNVIVGVDAATAFAESLEATAYSPDVTNTPTPATAQAAMPEATGIGGHDEAVTVDVMTASAEMTEPEFSNITDINITAVAMSATARQPQAVEVVYDGTNIDVQVTTYTTTTDPFIAAVAADMGTSAGPQSVWLRFGQTTAAPLKNYAISPPTAIGGWVGDPEFGVRDDFQRPATSFAGDSYATMEYGYEGNVVRGVMTWEYVFRTTTDGPLSSGEDAYSEVYSHVEIRNGRVNVVAGSLFNAVNETHFPALGRVDDGKWHHVMVSIGPRGLEVFIDGESRLRRYKLPSNTVPTQALPQERIGSNKIYSTTFTGDILMFAQYPREMNREVAQNHYYAYMYATVVKPVAMTASAAAGTSKGRGNGLRALALYSAGGTIISQTPRDNPNWTSLRTWVTGGDGYRHYNNNPFKMGQYTVFPRSIGVGRNEYDNSPKAPMVDEIPDLEDYDMFFFIDLPLYPNTVINDRDYTGLTFNMGAEYEKFVESIRRAIDNTGISLWCPIPQLAISLGIVDAVEMTPLQREAHDYESFNTEFQPWRNSQSTHPDQYVDTHFKNAYRVTADVEGFTDLEGTIVQDIVYWENSNPFTIRPDYIKYNALDLTGRGLLPGDNVYFPVDTYELAGTQTDLSWAIRHYVWSVPAGKYRGTAVAKEQTTINMRGVEVANPRAENAMSIVVSPGDNVGGRPIGGKVFVDFQSGYKPPTYPTGQLDTDPLLLVQIPPFGNFNNPVLDVFDGYDYDSRRMNVYFEWRETSTTRSTRRDSGDEQGVTEFSRVYTSRVPIYTESEKYPVMWVEQYPWLVRAFNWLGIKEELEEGDVRVIASRSTASASMPTAGVTVQKHNVKSAGTPARALAQIIKPASVVEPDVTVTTLPMAASARMLELATVVSPTPVTAYAEMPEGGTVRGTGQDYVLSIKSFTTATLYLKEDAV